MNGEAWMKRRGFTLIELMIVIAIIAVIAAIAIPGLLASQRASNERNASTSLKTLTAAEADFRSNDRDGNHVNDFWTGDVKSLYTLTNCAIKGALNDTTDPAIKLIELSIASADADATFLPCVTENCNLSTFSISSSKAGYWYNALATDAGLSGSDATYQQQTGGLISMGSVHNLWRFAFTCWPDTMNSGKFIYLIDENNTIYRSATTGSVKPSANTPPGIIGAPYNSFPSSGSLKSYWSKLD